MLFPIKVSLHPESVLLLVLSAVCLQGFKASSSLCSDACDRTRCSCLNDRYKLLPTTQPISMLHLVRSKCLWRCKCVYKLSRFSRISLGCGLCFAAFLTPSLCAVVWCVSVQVGLAIHLGFWLSLTPARNHLISSLLISSWFTVLFGLYLTSYVFPWSSEPLLLCVYLPCHTTPPPHRHTHQLQLASCFCHYATWILRMTAGIQLPSSYQSLFC